VEELGEEKLVVLLSDGDLTTVDCNEPGSKRVSLSCDGPTGD
jgi:hypothetical protein